VTACGNNTDEANGFDWVGGDFQFFTLAAEDACLDGALEVLFMPEGPAAPHEHAYPTYLPSFDELPHSYEISLREPFVNLPITVTSEDGVTLVGDGVIDDVALGSVAYGDCVVTMTAHIEMVPASADQAYGTAWMDISDPRGDDERCPVYEADPCRVTLTLDAILD